MTPPIRGLLCATRLPISVEASTLRPLASTPTPSRLTPQIAAACTTISDTGVLYEAQSWSSAPITSLTTTRTSVSGAGGGLLPRRAGLLPRRGLEGGGSTLGVSRRRASSSERPEDSSAATRCRQTPLSASTTAFRTRCTPPSPRASPPPSAKTLDSTAATRSSRWPWCCFATLASTASIRSARAFLTSSPRAAPAVAPSTAANRSSRTFLKPSIRAASAAALFSAPSSRLVIRPSRATPPASTPLEGVVAAERSRASTRDSRAACAASAAPAPRCETSSAASRACRAFLSFSIRAASIAANFSTPSSTAVSRPSRASTPREGVVAAERSRASTRDSRTARAASAPPPPLPPRCETSSSAATR
eukprot:Hpha_TRINITY_DN15949_c0_g2::TRINITY_DN15949_c0_g2_i1::g.75180::m.75180